MKIYQKMAAILAEFPGVSKGQTNPSQKYNYRGIDDALSALHPLLCKHGVFLQLVGLQPEFSDAGTTNSGKTQTRCSIRGCVRFVCGEDGSYTECSLIGEGVDMGDKAMMKAQANGLKYVIWYTFAVPTDEKTDSEAFEDPEPTKAPSRTKRAALPPPIQLEPLLKLSAAKTYQELTKVWTEMRPDLLQMAADDPQRGALVDAYKKKQAELGG